MRAWQLGAVLSVTLGACAPPLRGPRLEQGALARLEAESGRRWRLVAAGGRALHLDSVRETGASQPAPIDFLDAQRDLLGLRDPRAELTIARRRVDRRGHAHAHYRQHVHGIPVIGGEVAVHTDAEGRITSIDSSYVPIVAVDVTPRVALETARRSLEHLGAVDAGELVVWPAAGGARLGWSFRVDAMAREPAIWRTIVDAESGAVLERWNDFQTLAASGVGLRGDTRAFEASSSGAADYVMVDASGKAEVRTHTAGKDVTLPGPLVLSSSLTSWDTEVDAAGAAVDAHVNAALVLRYYESVHGRNALDGEGGALVSTVHYAIGYENAGWTGGVMVYGDGGPTYKPMAANLDVVAHEFTHGVTAATSKLVYKGESGALNEGLSDLFGAFIERSVTPDPIANWTFGEGVPVAGGVLRDLADPRESPESQPAHMKDFVVTPLDNGGVHTNSGIIAVAGYLMTVGGKNPVSGIAVKGIGWEKSEQIWYRANVDYFLQTSRFDQAAAGVVEAAKDLGLDEAEIAQVSCAFEATGILEGGCAAAPTSDAEAPSPPPPPLPTLPEAGPSPEADAGAPESKPAAAAESGCACTASRRVRGAELPLLAIAVGAVALRRRRRG